MPDSTAIETEETAIDVSRRVLVSAGLAGGLAAAAALAVNPALAASEHDHHAGHGAHGAAGSDGAKHQALLDVAAKCMARGEACLNHCIALMSTGDTSLKDCIRTVSVMLPMCGALLRVAGLDAARLKDVAKVCIDVCDDCVKACKPHIEHHALCKACSDSCTECIDACKKVI